MYKVTDRDGMYVRVAPTGGISFRLDYRLNGRRETVHLGRYARDAISLARASELSLDARRMIAEAYQPPCQTKSNCYSSAIWPAYDALTAWEAGGKPATGRGYWKAVSQACEGDVKMIATFDPG